MQKLRLFVLGVRDCRQITFVTLNGFCPLINPPPHPPPALNGQYQNGWSTNQNHENEKYIYTFFTLDVFEALSVRLIKICKIQPPNLLFVFAFISFYIGRYHFSKTFRTSFNNSEKNIFASNFLFLMHSLRQPPPLLFTPLMAKIRWAWLTFFVDVPSLTYRTSYSLSRKKNLNWLDHATLKI